MYIHCVCIYLCPEEDEEREGRQEGGVVDVEQNVCPLHFNIVLHTTHNTQHTTHTHTHTTHNTHTHTHTTTHNTHTHTHNTHTQHTYTHTHKHTHTQTYTHNIHVLMEERSKQGQTNKHVHTRTHTHTHTHTQREVFTDTSSKRGRPTMECARSADYKHYCGCLWWQLLSSNHNKDTHTAVSLSLSQSIALQRP